MHCLILQKRLQVAILIISGGTKLHELRFGSCPASLRSFTILYLIVTALLKSHLVQDCFCTNVFQGAFGQLILHLTSFRIPQQFRYVFIRM